ncbi:MAG TPA: two-component regulator propeller domain-containing protein, partial [Bacteroidales bacterium]|nr:two-component regulator propeller domain-containing protein [Bacteroidales bacterium]
MTYPRTLGFLFALLIGLPASAQGIGIGHWRDHLPYNNVISLAEAGKRIYGATPYSLYFWDDADGSINRLGKVEGLSDFGISWITYSEEHKTLVIAYTNTNIDLLRDGKIINISDIKRKPILGNKTINKATFIGEYCYLSCGFGIVVLDVEKKEIKDTWYIGPDGGHVDVLDLAYDGTYLYAATDEGLFSASFDHPNLANFESWTHDETLPHPQARYNALALFHNHLLANHSNTAYNTDTLYMRQLPDGTWTRVPNGNTYGKNGLKVFGDILYEVNNGDVTLYDTLFNSLGKIYQYIQPDSVILPFPQDVHLDARGYLWIGDQRSGLVRTHHLWESAIIRPDGPSGNLVYEMSVSGNSLWVAPGGRNLQWGNIYYEGALYSFTDERWSYLDPTNSTIFNGVRDVLTVLVDPSDRSHVWAGSWGSGLFEFRDGSFVARYDGTNSALQAPPTLSPAEVRVGGMAYDQDHNLWVATSSADDLLCVRKNDGEWQSIYLGGMAFGASQAEVGKIVIDDFGQKWVMMRGARILVYNDNHTIGQLSDDQARLLGSGVGQGNLKGSRVFSMARDRDGEIWVGTDEGVVVFYTPGNVFSGYDFDAQQVLVEVGGYAQYLLEEETVTAIAVDGANRKWFGTDRAGVFLMSADGTEQIHHFTSENSPLLSNSITDIAINHL